jgi:hypothetical protein
MRHVCDKLGVTVHPFQLKRRLHISLHSNGEKLEVFGSSQGQRHSIITRVEVFDQTNLVHFDLDKEPFTIDKASVSKSQSVTDSSIELRVHFQGHYSEPNFSLEIPRSSILELEDRQ